MSQILALPAPFSRSKWHVWVSTSLRKKRWWLFSGLANVCILHVSCHEMCVSNINKIKLYVWYPCCSCEWVMRRSACMRILKLCMHHAGICINSCHSIPWKRSYEPHEPPHFKLPTKMCQRPIANAIRKESKRPTSPRKTWNLSTDPIHTFAKNKIHAKFKRLQTINDTFPCYLRSMLDKSNSCIHSFIESSMHSFIQFTVCTVFVLFIHVLNLFVFHFTIYTHIIYYVLLNKSI